jgi:predicted dehydrogenase
MTPGGAARGAFVGFGHVASEGHAPAWLARPDVDILAAVEVAPERRARFEEMWPGARAFTSFEDLLADERLDFVDICTPPGSHAGLARQALERGLHVLCEKPLTTRLDDALALAEAAARSDRVLYTVHNWLASPICRRITQLVDSGALGAVSRVEWSVLRTRPSVAVGGEGEQNWRLDPEMAGGGILLDHGWHALYCVTRWLGEAPRRIAALLENRRFTGLPVEDTATLDLDCGPAKGRILLTWAADERSNGVEIEGEKGHIHVEGQEVVFECERGVKRWSCPPALSEGSHHPDWFADVARDFRAAVDGQGVGNLDQAVLCARLMDLAQRSSAAGARWLDLPAGAAVS